MTNFLATVVFVLPGFLLYFWIQLFGVNPVVRHNTIQVTAISALLWLPVSVIVISILNGVSILFNFEARTISTLKDLEDTSGNLYYLTTFLLLSVLVSFIIAALWSKYIYSAFHLRLVNKVRKWRNAAEYSETPSVWEEVFLKNEAQVVEVGKIGDSHVEVGEIKKASRTFEPDRNLYLSDQKYYKDLIKKYDIPVSSTFVDTRTGIYVKVYESKLIKKAIEKEDSTSSQMNLAEN
ncbi:DUF6338 family protein [Virgibacillus pantothenticus]|uniref:DUF6338 family protein n=1 Tax=Virgibacillus pantothenticus TaxID=1473 RepID=UPI001BCAD269|nr:DUF6338 family protein [Virgibacillus pantothenticus]